MCRSKVFLNRSAENIGIQASPRASKFVKDIFTTTWGMHTTSFEQHLLNHCAIVMFTFMQLHKTWAAFMLPLSSHCTPQQQQCFVILAQLHSCYSTRKTLCERSRSNHEMESRSGSALRFETVALTYATLWTYSSTRCIGTTFCAVQRGWQSCFNAISEFSPFFWRFP